MKTDGCVGPKRTRFRISPTKKNWERISHRNDIGRARLKGPDHLHPPDFELDHVPWYVQTHEFQRTVGHWNSPRYNISLYEVTNVSSWKRKLPVLRRVMWDHERDFRNVKDLGLFDPSVFAETIARMTRNDAVKFDSLCQTMLDSLPKLERQHIPVMPRPHKPKTLMLTLATSEFLWISADGFEVQWDSKVHADVDKPFEEIWSFMDEICSDTKRQLDGWTDGYSKAPDADARAWAKSLRR